eukprot:SAG31_NODE_24413_length_482_cov_0.537859_1_plen_123_part_00
MQVDQPVSPPSSPTTDRQGQLKIVFDWDDTLLPTTQLADNYADTITGVLALPPISAPRHATEPQLMRRVLRSTGSAQLPQAVIEELVALQTAAIALLVEAVTIAQVTIVTNARPGTLFSAHI